MQQQILKTARDAVTSDFSKMTDLSNLKSDVDKLDFYNLKKVCYWFKQIEKQSRQVRC